MKKNMAIAMFLAGLLVISFSACSKGGDGPTTPTLPNSFQIITIDNYGDNFGNAHYNVVINYANNTDADAVLTGTFYFGDGASLEVAQITTNPAGWILSAKTTTSGEVGRFDHDYASLGTYRVKAEFTVTFKNESISRILEKDFTLTR